MNLVGLVAALATFSGVWFGHVAVRKVEFHSPTIWLPTAAFATVGLASEWFSLITSNILLSIALGIFGITLLWDAIEVSRQQNRIKKGHAPANPNNPRHVRFMREHNSITDLDLLKRNPIGRPVSSAEAIQLVTEA